MAHVVGFYKISMHIDVFRLTVFVKLSEFADAFLYFGVFSQIITAFGMHIKT